MALTAAQLNAHLRQIVILNFTRNEEGLKQFLLTCRDYAVAGGAAEKEAAQTIAREAFSKVLRRALTAADIHVLQKHHVEGGDLL